jgi:hypothetical protein
VDYSNDVTYAAEPTHQRQGDYELKPVDDFVQYLREYTRERPEVVALTCFGIGFVLGWKLKPW